MLEPQKAPDSTPAQKGSHAELAKLAQDQTAEVKAGLARLALDDVPEDFHLAARLRNYFLTGLVIVGPVAITLYIANYFINVIDGWVRPYIPDIYNPNAYLPFRIPGVGLLFAIIGLTLIGALTANLLGRSFISAGEMMVGRMPIVRNVYEGLKQIFRSVMVAINTNETFPQVALIQFPSKGIWSLGFVTADAANEFRTAAKSTDLISVFVAHGLLPPSGFTCFVPRTDVIPLKMSVQDAARIILSVGMTSPGTPKPKAMRLEKESGAPPGASS
jgi:uncharacterized membrane protein